MDIVSRFHKQPDTTCPGISLPTVARPPKLIIYQESVLPTYPEANLAEEKSSFGVPSSRMTLACASLMTLACVKVTKSNKQS